MTGLSIACCCPSMIYAIFCNDNHLLFPIRVIYGSVSRWQTWPNHDDLHRRGCLLSRLLSLYFCVVPGRQKPNDRCTKKIEEERQEERSEKAENRQHSAVEEIQEKQCEFWASGPSWIFLTYEMRQIYDVFVSFAWRGLAFELKQLLHVDIMITVLSVLWYFVNTKSVQFLHRFIKNCF